MKVVSNHSKSMNSGDVSDRESLRGKFMKDKEAGNYGQKSSSPRHLQFLQYRENLIDRSQPDPRTPILSDKTKKFLSQFESNRILLSGSKSHKKLSSPEVLNKTEQEFYTKANKDYSVSPENGPSVSI